MIHSYSCIVLKKNKRKKKKRKKKEKKKKQKQTKKEKKKKKRKEKRMVLVSAGKYEKQYCSSRSAVSQIGGICIDVHVL